jgi:hypothetical protein
MENIHVQPLALYDTSEKRLVGVFRTIALLERYLFDSKTYRQRKSRQERLRWALVNKKRIDGSNLPFAVAIRYASEVQRELLEKNDYSITKGYHLPDPCYMGTFKFYKQHD